MRKQTKVLLWALLGVVVLAGATLGYMYKSGSLFSSADVASTSAEGPETHTCGIKEYKCSGDTRPSNCRQIAAGSPIVAGVRAAIVVGDPGEVGGAGEKLVWEQVIADGYSSTGSSVPHGDTDGTADGLISYFDNKINNENGLLGDWTGWRWPINYIWPDSTMISSDCSGTREDYKRMTSCANDGQLTSIRILCKRAEDSNKGAARIKVQTQSTTQSASVSSVSASSITGATIQYRQGSGSWQNYGTVDEEGVYGAYLAPGTYDFKAELTGYSPTTITGKQVTVSGMLNETIQLTPIGVTPTTTATRTATPTQTTTTSATTPPSPTTTPISSGSFRFFTKNASTGKAISGATITLEVKTQPTSSFQTYARLTTNASGLTSSPLRTGYSFANTWRAKIVKSGYKSRTVNLTTSACTSAKPCSYNIALAPQ